MWLLWFFLEGGQNTYERSYRDKVWGRDWRNDYPETARPGNPSHKQPPKPDTIVDASKSLLTGVWSSCLLRGSASAWQIQQWMLTAIHWTEYRVLNEGARESTQGAGGVCSPIGGTTVWTKQCCLSFIPRWVISIQEAVAESWLWIEGDLWSGKSTATLQSINPPLGF